MVTETVLAGLDPSIVPHSDWWRRQWFQAEGGRYYHRRFDRGAFKPGAAFYRRVDPQLRALCRALHRRGLATTPSCQGHFHGRAHFEKSWTFLQREATLITRDGLPVIDAETDEHYRFRDPDYRLPWPSFEAFLRDSMRHQTTGYLGVEIPGGERGLWTRLRTASTALPAASIAFEQAGGEARSVNLMHLFVHPRDARDGARQWRLITRWLSAQL